MFVMCLIIKSMLQLKAKYIPAVGGGTQEVERDRGHNFHVGCMLVRLPQC